MDVEQMIRDRDVAVLSLDKDKIFEYLDKYGIRKPFNDYDYQIFVCKSILGIASAPEEMKKKAEQWLLDRCISKELL